MPIEVLSDVELWLAEHHLTGVTNSVALNYGVELQDATVFGNASRRRVAGLKTVDAQAEGFLDSTAGNDKAFYDRIGLVNEPLSIAPTSTEGGRAFTFRAAESEYSQPFAVGDMYRYSVTAQGNEGEGLIRGSLLLNGTKNADGSGTSFQLGSVSATQKLYAALHVTAVSGTPTLTAKVQSDDNSGFTTPSDRITFTQMTATGAQFATPVAGEITDDWWRVNFTIGGTSPSFTFAVIAGIQ